MRLTDDALVVDLAGGRSISAPLAWYPRVLHGSAAERSNYRVIASGEGIHGPELDDDISIDGLLSGRASGETAASLQKWLDGPATRHAND